MVIAKEYRWAARNKNGELYAYTEKPILETGSEEYRIVHRIDKAKKIQETDGRFIFIKSDDAEPTRISPFMLPAAFDKATRYAARQRQILETYVRKNNDYGDSFSEVYKKLGIVSAVTQIAHKTNRIINLADKSETQQVKEESIKDTLEDLIGYAMMTLIELDIEAEAAMIAKKTAAAEEEEEKRAEMTESINETLKRQREASVERAIEMARHRGAMIIDKRAQDTESLKETISEHNKRITRGRL